jgi:CNT family concentrative nucleoside transporter
VFAVKVLPVIIYFASLMAVLYHIGLMPRIVAALAWLLRRSLGVSGAEALAMAANVFVGQTEAPLCIKPYLDRMSRAGLMTLMVGGFATIAGSVLAGYVNFLTPLPAGPQPGMAAEAITAAQAALDAAKAQQALWIRHLLTASVMSAPAAFVMARVLVPETARRTRPTSPRLSRPRRPPTRPTCSTPRPRARPTG